MQPKAQRIFIITFVVSLCSIIYELIFAQALTVIFGGTVVRYSVTIGLYLLFLGIGSFAYPYLNKKYIQRNFLGVELILSIVGPLGLFYILFINALPLSISYGSFEHNVLLVLSHLPIVVVGFLSGLELPHLSDLNKSRKQSFAETLGVDYLGGLAGTLVYGIILYPQLGLISSILIVGLLNLVAAIVFLFHISKRKLWHYIVVACIAAIYLLSFLNLSGIEDTSYQIYYGSTIKANYQKVDLPVRHVAINDFLRTTYQDVIFYDLYVKGKDAAFDSCMNIDEHVQMCEKWVRDYHTGLIDIPMAYFNNSTTTDVLVLGGGDWIPAQHLLKYNVDINQVDIDKTFSEFAKTNEYLIKFHQHSYLDPRLNVRYDDAFSYVRYTQDKYDLIVVDLPGAMHDKLMHLYSVEFFTYLRDALSDDGLVVFWTYNERWQPTHNEVFIRTLRAAGFDDYYPYSIDFKALATSERFYILSKSGPKEFIEQTHPLFIEYPTLYTDVFTWQKLPVYDDRKVNSVFNPNYDIITSHNV